MKRKLIQTKCFKLFLLAILAMFTFTNVYAQQGETISVSGNVKDHQGIPLTGASVVVKGTTNGVMTDFDGNFEIQAPQNGILVISIVGSKTKEIAVAGKKSHIVVLDEDVEMLKEVVVIGYGSVKKDDLTGSVTTISANTLAKGMATSATDLLVGKAPGLTVTTDGGAPGSGAVMRIRGGSSAKASNDPLVVIDGLPVVCYGAISIIASMRLLWAMEAKYLREVQNPKVM